MKPLWSTRIEQNTPEALARLAQDLREMLNNGLTITDNLNAAYVTAALPNTTEVLIANPLHTIPKDVTAVYAEIGETATYAPLLKWRMLNERVLAITATYIAAPSGTPNVRLRIVAG